MRVVSNTSPIIFLSKIDALHLLGHWFREVFIPPAVERELGADSPAGIQRAALSVQGQQYVRGAIGRLHAGELEAIVLAQEVKADYVVLDDLRARFRTCQAFHANGPRAALKESGTHYNNALAPSIQTPENS